VEVGERARMKSIKAVIAGRVQGVCFRAFTREKALELGVKGYVRNMPDGSVELVASGEPAAVDALVGWVSQGPPGSRVRDVSVNESATDEKYDRFFIAY
jgi:acylphosphatase